MPVTIVNTGTFNVPPVLPPGVTLQAIDGGPTYYADNGFTYAASPSGGMAGKLSWDDPAFFPIGNDFCFYPSHSTATFFDLGLNFTHRVTSDADLSVLRSAGVWVLAAADTFTGLGEETVGWHVEEPTSWNDAGDSLSVTTQASAFSARLAGRFLHVSCTWNQLYFENLNDSPGTRSMPSVFGSAIGSTGRHLNIPADDLYYFAGSATANGQYQGGHVQMDNGGTATVAQMARGTNYGDMVDIMRHDWLAVSPASAAPIIAPYIETEDGLLTDSGTREILPAELNWAAWATIIHGARGLLYFGTTSNFGTGGTFGFSPAPLPGQSISVYAQGKNTNTLVTNLAQIINSPFALGYVTVSPAAYNFPVPLVMDGARHGWATTGIDVMAKYYTGGAFTNAAGTFGNGFYVFACYRGAETDTNIPATFTVAGGYSGPVHAVNADGGGAAYGTAYTLTATGGQFTDTFTSGSSVRIYRIG